MDKLFSYADRPVHLGPYPLERLSRIDSLPEGLQIPPMRAVDFVGRGRDPGHLMHAIRPYQAMLDATRDGLVKRERAEIPSDLEARSQHLKAFGYYCDASQMAVCALGESTLLDTPLENPGVAQLAADLQQKQVKSLSAGVDVIMAELRESMSAPPADCSAHDFALVFLYEYPRDPEPRETECRWISDMQAQRACVRAAESAVVVANYLRLLGYCARAHSGTAAEVDLNQLAVRAGLAEVREGELHNPYVGPHFGLAAVTTTLALAPDRPLKPRAQQSWRQRWHSHGPAWHWGRGHRKRAGRWRAFAQRRYQDGPWPFETLKRLERPTTFIDRANIPRVPKRTDMFVRAQFGDMGKRLQDSARNGHFMRKSATAFAPRRTLGALMLLQESAPLAYPHPEAQDPLGNAARIKAAGYFLGVDAIGISACPEWAYYSHDSHGHAIQPYHPNAISMIIDQGHETMEGASGDDWIACSQSMRAYLRFSFLGGMVAEHIRLLGYEAKVHTSMDSEVLHPPLLLLSGLGEVSRIGEVILNPFLGPRLKSGIITTNMPLAHDRPIDFGLQNFCENCQKCARECPSGAITAGPKVMFNGYETWKSDSQKCTTYRITTEGGAMCGRCMKTCPWNLEGLFAEKPFRWAAMHWPKAAKHLAKLDDALGNGEINPVKKWWWDLEMVDEGPYRPSDKPLNQRRLQKGLRITHEEQTLAVYPAHLTPPPWSYPYPMDREAGIQAYQALYPPLQYQRLLASDAQAIELTPRPQHGDSPVLSVRISRIEQHNEHTKSYILTALDGADLPAFEAGAHIDVMVTADCFRQYSLASDPADRSHYRITVQREEHGRGGSKMLHRVFTQGRRITISQPINHFPLVAGASKSYLFGGGIGITPMMAMAYQLHAQGAIFELHYSASTQAQATYVPLLAQVDWADKVHFHFSDVGTRADFAELIPDFETGQHLYTCGSDGYMQAVIQAAERAGFPASHRHLEYFSAPQAPEYTNHAFTIKLHRSGQTLEVAPEQSAAEVLNTHGFHVPIKCSDGICGVCQCKVVSGDIEHRDYVLSAAQRERSLILCQSRAREANAVIELDL